MLFQVYMPTNEHREEDGDEEYEQLEEIIREIPGKKNLIVMGDWNALVGERRDGDDIGEFGLGISERQGRENSSILPENFQNRFCVKTHKRKLRKLFFSKAEKFLKLQMEREPEACNEHIMATLNLLFQWSSKVVVGKWFPPVLHR